MKRFVVAVCSIMLVFGLFSTLHAREIKRYQSLSEMEEINSVIEKYYDTIYNSYLDLNVGDLSDVLDTNHLWANNVTIFINRNIESLRYRNQKKYSDISIKKLPLNVNVTKILQNEDFADAEVQVEGNGDECYPLIIGFGKNDVKLKKTNGTWKIISIKNDKSFFEDWDKRRIKGFNVEELHKKNWWKVFR